MPVTCDGEIIPWGDAPSLDVTLHGECGDGDLFSGGYIDSAPQYYKEYIVDVPAYGGYTMRLGEATGSPSTKLGLMTNCPGVEPGAAGSIDGQEGPGILHPGLHRILIGFPASAELDVKLQLRLDYIDAG